MMKTGQRTEKRLKQLIEMDPHKKNERIEALIREARQSGATEAVVVLAKDIVVDSNLADLCHEPRCEQYGLSRSCPPHVAGPSAFIDLLETFSQAIFFKIDAPTEVLYSSERREFSQLLHEIAAGIEQAAVNAGFVRAQAYAGGSCKKIFCHEHPECRALSDEGTCRNPRLARPSMSGFGINVSKLAETAGWKMSWDAPNSDSTATKMAGVYGLVLID